MNEDDQAAAIAEQNKRKLQEHLRKLAESGTGKDPGKGEYTKSMERGAFRKGLFEEDAEGGFRDPGQIRAEWEAWKRYHGSKIHDLSTPPPKDAKDDFRLLGIRPGAGTVEIRKAFYKLAKTAHPDAGGNAEKFQKLLEAYERLSAQAAAPQSS